MYILILVNLIAFIIGMYCRDIGYHINWVIFLCVIMSLIPDVARIRLAFFQKFTKNSDVWEGIYLMACFSWAIGLMIK